ncbi:MAG: hypothetical protein ACRDTH_15985 [Pseudonocardiaceae bacterium]
MSQPAIHQAIVVVDVAGFTDPKRTMVHQVAVQEGLYNVLRVAFAEAGIDLNSCTLEDRGDGAMILVPPEVAKTRLADQLPSRLVAGLRRYNAVHSLEAAVQLRVGLHAGEVYHNSRGVVGHAVNLAFRILEAPEAKIALTTPAGGVLALIVSDTFYQDVVFQDPATDPSSYRQISVSVKKTSAVAWLRLPDGAIHAEQDERPEPQVQVQDLLPEPELQRLRPHLDGLAVAQLPALMLRAAGPSVPTLPTDAGAWKAFCQLTDFNAGKDGFPPALMFVELVARQVGGEVSTTLKEWNNDLAHRLGLTPELLERRTAVTARAVVESRLHLLVVVQHDGNDPDRYRVSHWRQDDPEEWPPPRGETREVMFDELEQCVDDLVVSAEQAWAGRSDTVALEFVLPRALLNLPVHLWHKERDSGYPRPLCLDYPVVLRSLERMRSPQWHRVWHQHWEKLMEEPSAAQVYFGESTDTGETHRVDADLRDPQWALMVLSTAPPRRPRSGTDELTAALRAGLPAVVWHPEVPADLLRDVVGWLVDDGIHDLPGRTHDARLATFRSSAALAFDVSIVRNLVVLWDEPHRLVVLGQAPPTGGHRGWA